MKDNVTMYTKPVPNITSEDVVIKDKSGELKEQQKFMEEGKFRQYAMEYWEKRKSKASGNAKD